MVSKVGSYHYFPEDTNYYFIALQTKALEEAMNKEIHYSLVNRGGSSFGHSTWNYPINTNPHKDFEKSA